MMHNRGPATQTATPTRLSQLLNARNNFAMVMFHFDHSSSSGREANQLYIRGRNKTDLYFLEET